MVFRILISSMLIVTSHAAAQGWIQARPWAVTGTINDARILGTLGAADANVDESAKLASTKGKSAQVRDFAKKLVKEHQASFRENTELAKRFGINRLLPNDSAMARSHKQAMDSLNLLSGDAFDMAFLHAAISDHATLATQIKSTFLPAAERKGVKEFVRELIPMLKAHQATAQQLLDKHK